MRLVIGLFACAVLATAAACIGIAGWTGHLGHHDANLRAIHYDTNYDLSAQRPTLGPDVVGARGGARISFEPC